MSRSTRLVFDQEGAERPEYVYSRGKAFLSSWAEDALRAELANYRQALEEIAAEDDQQQALQVARQALVAGEKNQSHE